MSTSTTQAINFAAKLALFDDRWQPRVIAQMNDYQFKLVKIEGDFVWHSHADTDETFIVLAGRLRIDFRDGAVHLGPGEMYVVPRGVEHKPFAGRGAHAPGGALRRAQYRRPGRRADGRQRSVDLNE